MPNNLKKFAYFLLLMLAFTIPNTASAYIGPGAGLSAIGTIIAVIGALILAVVGFIWYPVKRLLKARKQPNKTTPSTSPTQK